ncbi:MAG: aminotransferase class V-fold PLP-dependent enzyme [Bacteroidetes bacterium]|nr:aminotransferase class V-fold PLP-dependent enzyme [Bacteroidota bacterium]
MEQFFRKFRENTVGNELEFITPYGKQKMIYADWIASGRLYAPIEHQLLERFGPFVGNTHTETSETGTMMTQAYHYAHELIKKHVNAGSDDVIITTGFGMTGAVNKFQRILGLKHCAQINSSDCFKGRERPVVFITHMEHHSNHTSWFETMADVVVIPPGKGLLFDLNLLKEELEKYKDRKLKIGTFTACSNVTGVHTPYREMSKMMHEFGGLCFIDFAASAPYMDMDMHPADPMEKLDAIYFSPHKFLGGPGSSGVLIFDSKLYKNPTPDQPGGGTVEWTNPWGEYKYSDDIEVREDGGTPGFLQAIKTALCIQLKNQMSTVKMQKREEELVSLAFSEMSKVPGIHILADNVTDRLGAISFYIEGIHYNLLVKLLNDRFGIQVRGGCACAGTYGHYLLDVSYEHSHRITELISSGDLSVKPGWVRLSLHPTMTGEEMMIFADALRQIVKNVRTWEQDYDYNKRKNEFTNKNEDNVKKERIAAWFRI